MRNDLVFKNSYDAHIAAYFDPESLQKSGYQLKKFIDGYRYYPINKKQAYVIRNSQVVELGQHVSTYYWSGESKFPNQSKCLIIPFSHTIKLKQL